MGRIFSFRDLSCMEEPIDLRMNNHNIVPCPLCKSDPSYLHFDAPLLFNGHDDYAAKYCGWNGRGSLIAIPIQCEQCHFDIDDQRKMYLCFAFHKGQIFSWFFIPEIGKDVMPKRQLFVER